MLACAYAILEVGQALQVFRRYVNKCFVYHSNDVEVWCLRPLLADAQISRRGKTKATTASVRRHQCVADLWGSPSSKNGEVNTNY